METQSVSEPVLTAVANSTVILRAVRRARAERECAQSPAQTRISAKTQNGVP